jgi:hypothetical protein
MVFSRRTDALKGTTDPVTQSMCGSVSSPGQNVFDEGQRECGWLHPLRIPLIHGNIGRAFAA